jgi:DNA-binding transcriptional ArsR family regulator
MFEIAVDIRLPVTDVISMKVEIASKQLEALGNQSRLRIYRALVKAGLGGLPVGSLQERLELPGSTLSHHLKRLIDTGLVRQERSGTSLICHADYRVMAALIGFLSDECCAEEGGCGGSQANTRQAIETIG